MSAEAHVRTAHKNVWHATKLMEFYLQPVAGDLEVRAKILNGIEEAFGHMFKDGNAQRMLCTH